MDIEDLEDGEIESDEEQNPKAASPAKSPAKTETVPPASSKKQEDDWAENVENSIASALNINSPSGNKTAKQTTGSTGNSKSSSQQNSTRSAYKKEPSNSRRSASKQTSQRNTLRRESDEYDEDEMLCIRGGSPSTGQYQRPNVHSRTEYESDESYSSYGSYDSMEHRRTTYDERRRRRKHQNTRDHHRHQRHSGGGSRMNKRNDRKSDKHDDDQDDQPPQRNHEVRGPRKMELCKFYLMECCAKREKCLYMHGNFPCKYYYLGMTCENRERCKFSHGKPLTDQLRAILLKHLETAPKEILGDFQRISRDAAQRLITAQHAKLLVEYGMDGNDSTTENRDEPVKSTANLPSLLDIVTQKPIEKSSNNDKQSRKRKWKEDDNKTSTSTDLFGILSNDQIKKLGALGIDKAEQIQRLTVLQLTELGINFDQLQQLQQVAIDNKSSASKRPTIEISSPKEPDPEPQPVLSAESPPHQSNTSDFVQDVDMRYATVTSTVQSNEPSLNIDNSSSSTSNSNTRIDYSQYLKDSNLIMGIEKDAVDQDPVEDEPMKLTIDETWAADEDDSDDTSEDKSKETTSNVTLKSQEDIIPSYYSVIPNSWSSKVNKIDLSATVEADLAAERKSNNTQVRSDPRLSQKQSSSQDDRFEFFTKKVTEDVSQFDMLSSESKTGSGRVDSLSPTYKIDDVQKTPLSPPLSSASTINVQTKRSTIYDCNTDVDLNEDNELNSDSDPKSFYYNPKSPPSSPSSLPFKSIMDNYQPAVEIDGSITSHGTMRWAVVTCDIPPICYTLYRQQFASQVAVSKMGSNSVVQDPRIRRMFNLPDDDPIGIRPVTEVNEIKSPDATTDMPLDFELIKSQPPPSLNGSNAIQPTIPVLPPQPTPRLDPRRKKEAQETQVLQSNVGMNNDLSVNIQQLLQNSAWYRDLSSSDKMLVNQKLADLVTECRKYQNDRSPHKVFNMDFLRTNALLQMFLRQLGVTVNEQAELIPIIDNMSVVGGTQQTQNANATADMGISPDMMRAMLLLRNTPATGINFPGPPPDVRPGLLGVAPGIPYQPFNDMKQVNQQSQRQQSQQHMNRGNYRPEQRRRGNYDKRRRSNNTGDNNR